MCTMLLAFNERMYVYRFAGGGLCSTQPQPPRVPDELKTKRITEVALGTQHTLAVTAEGELLAAGSTEHSRLGLATEDDFGPSADGGCTCCPTFRYLLSLLACHPLFKSSSMALVDAQALSMTRASSLWLTAAGCVPPCWWWWFLRGFISIK